MTNVIPDANVDPQSLPWVRWVEENVVGLNKLTTGLKEKVANTATVTRYAIEESTGAAVAAALPDAVRLLDAAPQPPTNIVATPLAGWNSDGAAVGQIDLDWEPTQYDINGVSIAVPRYEIWGRFFTPDNVPSVDDEDPTFILPDSFTRYGNTENAPTSLTGLELGATYELTVRAVNAAGVTGPFSENVVVAIPSTLPAMAAPSAPVLSSDLSMIYAKWDGLLSDGTLPVQFSGIFAEFSQFNNGPWTRDGQNLLVPNTKSVAGPFTVGSTRYVSFIAIDRLNQVTARSAVSSIVVTGVSLNGMAQDALDAIAAGGGGAGGVKIRWTPEAPTDGPFKNGDIWFDTNNGYRISRYDEATSGWVPQLYSTDAFAAESITGSLIAAQTITAGLIGTDEIITRHIASEAITANEIKVGTITTALLNATAIDGMTITGSVFQTIATANRGVKFTSSGILGYNATGTQTFSLSTTGVLNATGATISGNITATSGTISGAMTVGASGSLLVGTAGAARVQIDSAGLRAYSATNVNTVTISATDGTVTVAGTMTVSGTIRTAASGARAEITQGGGVRSYDSAGAYATLISGQLQFLTSGGTQLSTYSASGISYAANADGSQITWGGTTQSGTVSSTEHTSKNTSLTLNGKNSSITVGDTAGTTGLYNFDGLYANTTGGASNRGVSVDSTGKLFAQVDSGWVFPAVPAPYGIAAGYEPKYRKVGRRVYLGGVAARGTGTWAANTWYTLFTLPAGYRPIVEERWPMASNNTDTQGALVITPAGQVNINTRADFSPAFLGMSHVDFFVD